jgi:hypothetical protein
METTAHNIGNVGQLVQNLPEIVLQPVTSRLAEWSPMISILLDPSNAPGWQAICTRH